MYDKQLLSSTWARWRARLAARVGLWARPLALAPNDLLRDPSYRRLWVSILVSSLGGQVTMLALPLTAAVLLHASPTQMGLLTAFEIAPFVLFSLPSGVWLDRVHKLPIYIAGEVLLALSVLTVPMAWWMGWLGMPWLYTIGFIMGCVHVVAGSAAQIVLTQVVPRERLVEAHARNALASSSTEVIGPGLAGLLIKLVGAPVALLVDAVMLLGSVLILRGLKVKENLVRRPDAQFMADLREGLTFVRRTPLLLTMACLVACWQVFHHAANVVQIIHATRTLGMNESQIGLAFVGLGVGTVGASWVGNRIASRLGPGPTLLLGMAINGIGWLTAGLAPSNTWGVLAFGFMLFCFGAGAVLSFINFLALRQAVTPDALLGRMTSTMRWLILLPAGPGALLGGWLGEHFSLRTSLIFAGVGALMVVAVGSRLRLIRELRVLPQPTTAAVASGLPRLPEAEVKPV